VQNRIPEQDFVSAPQNFDASSFNGKSNISSRPKKANVLKNKQTFEASAWNRNYEQDTE
jgi:hypothetical protein